MQNIHLLIIDPQKDFCNPKGSLFVPGADTDMERLAAFVTKQQSKLTHIHVTLDSHHLVDIAHPPFWVNSKGEHPTPFTIISENDVKNGTWVPKIPSLAKRALEYVQKLAVNKRYPLCIWPPHCLIGSDGYQIVPELNKALQDWAGARTRMIDYVAKGSNPFTEHYSAVKADVPDPKDPGTQMNVGLIRTLEEADTILLAGEAGSHCLANTVRDIADNFSNTAYVSKLVLLTDATSPVPSFEKLQEDFVKDMVARGMRLSTTQTWMA
jgi:nicotinamidase/pyrazinamidase